MPRSPITEVHLRGVGEGAVATVLIEDGGTTIAQAFETQREVGLLLLCMAAIIEANVDSPNAPVSFSAKCDG